VIADLLVCRPRQGIDAIPLVGIRRFGARSRRSPGLALVAVGGWAGLALLGMANAAILIPALIVLTSIHGPKGAAWCRSGDCGFCQSSTASHEMVGPGIGDIRQIFLLVPRLRLPGCTAVASLLQSRADGAAVRSGSLGLPLLACARGAFFRIMAAGGRPAVRRVAIGWPHERLAIAAPPRLSQARLSPGGSRTRRPGTT
jgi:hypothetical protein